MSATQSDELLHLHQQPVDGVQGASTSPELPKAAPFAPSAAPSDLTGVDLATLQVSGGAAAGKDAKADSKEESHEHPCVCDLRLPRKPLTNVERYARAKDWLRSGSAGRDGKSPGGSSERKRVASSRPAKRVVSATRKTKTSPENRKQGAGSRDEKSRSAKAGTERRANARSRSRGPQITVKLNRAATLRMEKGTTYCGKRPLPVDRFQMGRVQGTEEVRKKQRRARPADASCPHRACRRSR